MGKKQELQQRVTKNLPDASIPNNTSFTGDIETMAGVRVDGNIKGNVSAGGNVTVGTEGSIEGAVSANDVNIAGEILGDLTASGTVQMLSGAKLVGDLCASSFAIEQGAYFKGQCLICDTKEPTLLTPPADAPEEKKSDSKKAPSQKTESKKSE